MICDCYVRTARALTKVGTIVCTELPRRGEVVVLVEVRPDDPPPGWAEPVPETHHLVEQVVRPFVNYTGGAASGTYARAESALPNARLYLSPLDADGRVTPYAAGPLPGSVAPLAPGLEEDAPPSPADAPPSP